MEFRSHLDGALCVLTPERATDIQARLGSDIAMVLDECVGLSPAGTRSRRARRRWSGRCGGRGGRARASPAPRRSGDPRRTCIVTNPGQAQFGIIQGGIDPALRTESVQATVEIGFEAYAIGGLSVGEPVDVMYEVVGHTAPLLPADRPRYLMGTGMPDDLVECVARGIDMFDCVLPTRNARNGQLLTRHGRSSSRTRSTPRIVRRPIPDCGCYTCRHFQPGLSAAPFHGRRDDRGDPQLVP